MLTFEKVFYSCFALYLLGVVATFGYAAHNHRCVTPAYTPCDEQKAGTAMMAAMVWPLYWSWQVWE